MKNPWKSVGDYCLKQSKIAQCFHGDVPGDIGPLVQKVTVGVMNVLQEDRNYSAKWDKSKHMFQKLKMSSESFKSFDKKDYGTIKKGDQRRWQHTFLPNIMANFLDIFRPMIRCLSGHHCLISFSTFPLMSNN